MADSNCIDLGTQVVRVGETCPVCNSPRVHFDVEKIRIYQCASESVVATGAFTQSRTCRVRELERENQRLERLVVDLYESAEQETVARTPEEFDEAERKAERATYAILAEAEAIKARKRGM